MRPTEEPVWECGICGQRGPWFLTCRWFDDVATTTVPGGVTVFLDAAARMTRACSMECGRQFAKAVGDRRISIRRPETEDKWAARAITQLLEAKQQQPREAA